MRKSIFTEFFCLCAAVFISAVICVGVVLMLVSEEHYKANRFNYLSDKTEMIVDAVRDSVDENGGFCTLDTEEAAVRKSRHGYYTD